MLEYCTTVVAGSRKQSYYVLKYWITLPEQIQQECYSREHATCTAQYAEYSLLFASGFGTRGLVYWRYTKVGLAILVAVIRRLRSVLDSQRLVRLHTP